MKCPLSSKMHSKCIQPAAVPTNGTEGKRARLSGVNSWLASSTVVRPVILMTRCASRYKLLVQCDKRVEILRFSGFECEISSVQQQSCISHPLVLISGTARHHQQVCGFGQGQSAALDGCPLGLIRRRSRHDKKNIVRRGIDDVHHELTHRADNSIRNL